MPVRPQTIAKSWEDTVVRKLGDLLRRVQSLERRSYGQQRQIFLYFAVDGSLPFTWKVSRRSMLIDAANLDGAGAVTFTLNGADAELPITVDYDDRLVVTAAGTDGGLGVTLVETWPNTP